MTCSSVSDGSRRPKCKRAEWANPLRRRPTDGAAVGVGGGAATPTTVMGDEELEGGPELDAAEAVAEVEAEPFNVRLPAPF